MRDRMFLVYCDIWTLMMEQGFTLLLEECWRTQMRILSQFCERNKKFSNWRKPIDSDLCLRNSGDREAVVVPPFSRINHLQREDSAHPFASFNTAADSLSRLWIEFGTHFVFDTSLWIIPKEKYQNCHNTQRCQSIVYSYINSSPVDQIAKYNTKYIQI